MNEAQLVKTIKAHIAKGDHARDKADQHYISAGQLLKQLKADHAGNWDEWTALLKEKCNLSTGRASELMQIADGRKSIEGLRADNAAANQRLRDKRSSSRDEEKDGDPDTSATEDDAINTPDDGRQRKALHRPGLLGHARDAVTLAKRFTFDCENDAELSAAAKEAADAWGEIAAALAVEEPDEDDETFHEGVIKKLVARQKRWAQERAKTERALDEIRAADRPAIDALAARLVKLDAEVARSVFSALAIRGPCGGFEGVNFVLSAPFALALQDALADPQSPSLCAAQSTAIEDTVELTSEPEPTTLSWQQNEFGDWRTSGDANGIANRYLVFAPTEGEEFKASFVDKQARQHRLGLFPTVEEAKACCERHHWAPKKRGRPKGSKNKPKPVVEPPAAVVADQAAVADVSALPNDDLGIPEFLRRTPAAS
jgi:hypothetical protein